jgi:hypothetical protein
MRGRRPRLHADARGTTTVEYLVLMVCVLGVGYALWRQFGTHIINALGS